jgi:trimethylamine--corrinoid protein Co-methyltransferase
VPPLGGRFAPLAATDEAAIVAAALAILERVGMAGLPEGLARKAAEAGATQSADGRVRFPRAMVEAAIDRAEKRVDLPGFAEDRSLQIGGGRVHIGTGGAAVKVLEPDQLRFHDAGLDDLYAIMRILDQSEHIHYGVRPLVARDTATPLEMDLNTAFACLRATTKPIGVSFDNAGHVAPVTQLFDMALGGEGGFRRRPFCMAIVVHVVPPLRYAPEGVAIMEAAIRHRMPLQICSAGQAGATSPVTLAGALAQGLAESLAGLMVVDLIEPGFPCIFAFMPFVSDLRTGAMTGGGGECAVANAAAAQLLLGLGLPSTVAAGMTDAKTADAQAGHEKGHTVALAAQAGADMINLAVGMLGSIMVASPEMLAVDNDMCGAILRGVRGVEVDADVLDVGLWDRVVAGDGHFLGEAQTLARMKTDYVYPRLGDRSSVDDWMAAGAPTIWDRATLRVREILADGRPGHLPKDREAAIRAAFPIRLREDT